MTARELLQDLLQRGVSVRVDGAELVLKPAHLVPAELVPKIREAKWELIFLLSQGNGDTVQLPHVGRKHPRAHHTRVGGRYLLQRLWEAGYSLRLEPSEYGPGYVIIPVGKPSKPVDFPALFDLYDTFHDEAVKLILEACKALNIRPEERPNYVEHFAKETQHHQDLEQATIRGLNTQELGKAN